MSAPECSFRSMRKARKVHYCCECGDVINVGDVYQFTSGIWDGQPESFKRCRLCDDLANAVLKADRDARDEDYGLMFTALWEYVGESLNNDPEVLLPVLQSPEFKAHALRHCYESQRKLLTGDIDAAAGGGA